MSTNAEDNHIKSRAASIKRNFVFNMALTMSAFLFPLITYPYAARILLPEGMGKLAFAASLTAYFDMFAQLGIPTYGIRACARVRDDRAVLTRTVKELLSINLAFTLLSYIVFFLLVIFVPRFQDEKLLYCIMSLSVFCNSIGMEWMYKALEQYSYITARSIGFKLVSVVAMFLLVHSKEDYVIYGGITIFAGSASNILNLINAGKYVDLWKAPEGKEKRKVSILSEAGNKHLRAVLVFFAMSCATIIYTNLDTLMLGFMKPAAEVGYYNAAVKIKTVLVSIVTSLGAVLLPRLSYYAESGLTTEFYRICRKALNFVFVFAVPMSVYFIIYAIYGIRFLSGPAFDAAVLPMRIIMPTLILVGITNILGLQILVPLNREKEVLISEIAGAITDLALNAALIPVYGAAGAALGTLAAEIIVLAVQCYSLRNQISTLFRGISYHKILISTAIAALAAMAVSFRLQAGVFFILAATGIIFFTIYGLALLVWKEPIIMELFNTVVNRIPALMKLKE